MNTDFNPSAYPHDASQFDSEDNFPASAGMTLLDYFAGQALNGIIQRSREKELGFLKPITQKEATLQCAHAYSYAHDMLVERERWAGTISAKHPKTFND